MAQLGSLTHTRAMKKIDIIFAVGQTLLIGGLVFLSIGGRWSFYGGLVLVMTSALFALQGQRPTSLVGWIVRALLFIGCIAFLTWFSSFGTEKTPLAALVGVWLGCGLGEFTWWRKNRGLT